MDNIGQLASREIKACPECGEQIFECKIQDFDQYGTPDEITLVLESTPVAGYVRMEQRLRDDLVCIDVLLQHECHES